MKRPSIDGNNCIYLKKAYYHATWWRGGGRVVSGGKNVQLKGFRTLYIAVSPQIGEQQRTTMKEESLGIR